MEPAPEFTREVEESLAAVVAAVLADDRHAAAQPFWRFLQQGGRLPAGRMPSAALAGPPVYEVAAIADEGWDGVQLATELSGIPPLQGASVADSYAAALTVRGEALCHQSSCGRLGPVHLPWPAASVSCSRCDTRWTEDHGCHVVALRRGGGAVCEWWVSPSGDCSGPEEVRGLPPGDSVIAVEAGAGVGVALTASDDVHAWGHELSHHFAVSQREDGAAVRIEQLSGRRTRRLACGKVAATIETEGGELLCFGVHGGMSDPALMRLSADAPVCFPIRDMVTVRFAWLYLLDAAGAVWWIDMESQLCEPLRLPSPAQGQRVVRIGFAVHTTPAVLGRLVALSDCGELWCYSYTESGGVITSGWVCISATHPELPRGLLPCGGALAKRVLLLPDLSCGRARLQLFARIAGRLGLPSDVVRTALLRATVQSCYIVGNEDDPFCWPPDVAAAEPH